MLKSTRGRSKRNNADWPMRNTMVLGLTAAAAVVIAGPRSAASQTLDWKAVDSAMGRADVPQPSDVHRFNFPRTDLHVVVDGVTLRPALALGGWVAMKGTPGDVMAVGDLVLTADEVTPVVTALQKGGVEQTAIHHHVLRESPRVIYMHIHAHGDAITIASTIHSAIALTKIPPPAPPASAAMPSPFDVDTLALARELGYTGRINGGVYQVGVPRMEPIREGTFEFPPSMGVATAINFQPTGGGKAAITGDFVLIAAEVNPVIRALRDGGIEVTALHSHMLAEEPRLLFMHFWANADALALARTLHSAIQLTNSRKPAA